MSPNHSQIHRSSTWLRFLFLNALFVLSLSLSSTTNAQGLPNLAGGWQSTGKNACCLCGHQVQLWFTPVNGEKDTYEVREGRFGHQMVASVGRWQVSAEKIRWLDKKETVGFRARAEPLQIAFRLDASPTTGRRWIWIRFKKVDDQRYLRLEKKAQGERTELKKKRPFVFRPKGKEASKP